MRQKIPFRLSLYLPQLGIQLLAILTFMGLTAFLWTTLPTESTTTTLQQPTPIPAIEDTSRIKLDDIVLYRNDGEMFFDTNKTKKLHGFTGDSIIHYYGYLFDMGEHNELRLKSVDSLYYKMTGAFNRFNFSLYHKGYKVQDNAASFKVYNNIIIKGGTMEPFTLALDTSTVISEKTAKTNALKSIPKGLRTYRVETEKGIKKVKGKHEFVYNVQIWSWKPLEHLEVLVDPKSGVILDSYSLVKYCNGGHSTPHICANHTQTQSRYADILYYQLPNFPTLPPSNPSFSKQIDVTICGNDKVFFDWNDKVKLVNTETNPPIHYYRWDNTQDCAANTLYWVGKNVKKYY